LGSVLIASAAAAWAGCGGDSGNPGTGGGGQGGCPNADGYYTMITKDGPLCGDLNTNAPACITGSNAVCDFAISSGGPTVTIPSVNGDIVLKQNGTFSNATIFEGSSQTPRTGCDGSFVNGVLTINCGGSPTPMNNQWCKVTLTRTADACPGQP
jgi:hypothetical protein